MTNPPSGRPDAPLVLAVDSGSSSIRTVVAALPDRILADAREPVPWKHPRTGWVELDPAALWTSVRRTVTGALANAGVDDHDIAAVAITSHRETVVMWDARTGEPVHDAVVWISKQTDDIVQAWEESGLGAEFAPRTGLRNDSFFSAGKLSWLLDNVPDARRRAEAGEIIAGTIDSWLLWNLTGGEVHATDPSCASRTALFNLEQGVWDDELCGMLGIPVRILPEVRPSDGHFGRVRADLLPSRPPIRGVVADQQASMFGQACFGDGAVKHTLGTAGVLTVTTGTSPRHFAGLTSSVAWQVQDATVFEAEGVVFHSGQTLQVMREKWQLPIPPSEIDRLAGAVPDTGGVYLVPAFGGMAAPWWDRTARASMHGITLDTTVEHLVRAAVESMALQVVDIVEALRATGMGVTQMKVDGGGASSGLLCQMLADLTRTEVLRPRELERTSLGAALIAGIGIGALAGPDDVARAWEAADVFAPAIPIGDRDLVYSGWQAALERTLSG